MHWLGHTLLATIVCATYSAAEANFSTPAEEIALNEKNPDSVVPDFFFADPSTNLSKQAENNTKDAFSLTATEKREVENITFNDLKPLLLFPIIPFLFPPKEEEVGDNKKNESAPSSGGGKPFIFFDFAFNIRRIPIANFTDPANDSQIINVKKLSDGSVNDLNKGPQKNRRRRNSKVESARFFDDSPLFPDSELDEFLPKPDLFFPDLPFHHKLKKLSRRKRGQKKTEPKNDLKSFFDAFDEAFMRTKRELEWTDPILNFLRGGEPTLEEDKKQDGLFKRTPGVQKKPSVKWRIQRNIKRLNKDVEGELRKAHNSPTIIVDKVVKIGEFHVPKDSNKSKKKRQMIDSEWKSFEKAAQDPLNLRKNSEGVSKSIFDLFKKDKMNEKNHAKKSKTEDLTYDKLQSQEKSIAPGVSASFFSINKQEADGRDKEGLNDGNNTGKLLHLKNIFNSLKEKMQTDLKNVPYPKKKMLRPNQKVAEPSKIAFQDDLKKNLTMLLNQFMEINQNLNDAQLIEKIEMNERDDPKVFDWTEKETLRNTNVLVGGSKGRRQKKDAYFEDEYGSSEKKERQVADLNTLFFSVTVPTIFIFSAILLVCFYSLQVKGKICTKLFKPRQVLIMNDEATTQLKTPSTKKVQAI